MKKNFSKAILRHWNKVGLAGLIAKVSGAIYIENYPWAIQEPADKIGVSVHGLRWFLWTFAIFGVLCWIMVFVKKNIKHKERSST